MQAFFLIKWIFIGLILAGLSLLIAFTLGSTAQLLFIPVAIAIGMIAGWKINPR